MSCIYLGETDSRPADLTPTHVDARYHVIKSGLFWLVRCGSGEQTLYRSLFRTRALRVTAELNNAFLDGRFLGRFNKLPLNR